MLQLEHISFSITNGKLESASVEILKDISFKVAQGRHIAIIGESGCGKSTLLNYVYGLVPYKTGKVSWNNETLLGSDHHLVPGHDMMKYVPQEFDLMPFTTVFENVGEHLSIQLDDRESRIDELLDVVGMSSFKQRKVKTLSGGQKQRVAIAKALVEEPHLLLLDEPFSHIDNFRKNELRRKLFQFLKAKNISCLMATHDKNDILSFTDETIIMKSGRILDHRSTQLAYSKPLNVYCASLFDEVSKLESSHFESKSAQLFYPHELEISKYGLEVEVVQSFFSGKDFLIQGTYEKTPIYFRHHKSLPEGSVVHVDRVKELN